MSPWHVAEVQPVGFLMLSVRFADGTPGRARIDPSALSGVFAPLRDPAFFEQAFVDDGAVAWPGEIDLAPDAKHDEIGCSGEYVFA